MEAGKQAGVQGNKFFACKIVLLLLMLLLLLQDISRVVYQSNLRYVQKKVTHNNAALTFGLSLINITL